MRNLMCGCLVVAAVGLLAPPAAADFDETLAINGQSLTIANLAGEVWVMGHAGNAFEVEVRVRGADATRDRVELQVDESAEATLVVRLPWDEHRRFVYPEMGRGSRTELSVKRARDNLLERALADAGTKRVRVSGAGKGLEIWADLVVRVPKGRALAIYQGVGPLDAEDLEGDLRVSTASGAVELRRLEGQVHIVTGAGHCDFEDLAGDVRLATGSGHVTIARAAGEVLDIDTGSGHVDVKDLRFQSLGVDTGSGNVQLEAAAASRIQVDTGSGNVRARGVESEAVDIDTGSGGVTLDLTKMTRGTYAVATGSGGIRLSVPDDFSALVEAETGNGQIDVDLDGVRFEHRERDYVEFQVGSGDSDVRLNTGSGSVRIRGS